MKYGEKSKTGPEFDRWRVTHPECGTADVVALSDENAILNACREWGVSWGVYACECTVMRLGKAEKARCIRCGRVAETAGQGMCNQCRSIAAAERRQALNRVRQEPERRQWA